MKNQIFTGVAFSLVSMLAGAQYKYVGPDGKVSYSDTPPPAATKGVQKKHLAPATPTSSAGTGLPYELGLTAKNFPVTLYTSPGCEGCDLGRSFLAKRGIPFTEKTITTNDELQALKKLANTGGLPVMTVGNTKLLGYEPSGWGSALDTASYPANSALPPSYKPAAATPLIAKKPEVAAPSANQTAATGTPAPGAPAAPGGQTAAGDATAAPPAPAPAEKPSWFKGF